jgi:hypothetical protein
MNRFVLLALCAPAFLHPALAQKALDTFYVESFRRGSTHITEENFEAKLTPQNPVYRERIKDTRGADRYVMSIVPMRPEGDTNVTSWQVKLSDLHHAAIYENILMATQGPQDPKQDPKNNLWWLNPRRYSPVPIEAIRIIKVDSFYVTLQVKAYHFTPLDSPYLDSMTVAVRFTNSDPRSSETR